MLDNTIGLTSGSEWCRQLKTRPTTQHIKILLCSAADDLDRISKECLANNFLQKPFNLDQLDAAVAETI
jgi:DNA-binding response OmpR family regulator